MFLSNVIKYHGWASAVDIQTQAAAGSLNIWIYTMQITSLIVVSHHFAKLLPLNDTHNMNTHFDRFNVCSSPVMSDSEVRKTQDIELGSPLSVQVCCDGLVTCQCSLWAFDSDWEQFFSVGSHLNVQILNHFPSGLVCGYKGKTLTVKTLETQVMWWKCRLIIGHRVER